MKQLENEKEHYIADLLRMTTERDSLRERLRTITDMSISEKAHLEQSIENLQGKLRRTENDATELAELLRSVRERAEILDVEHVAMKERLQDAIEVARVSMNIAWELKGHNYVFTSSPFTRFRGPAANDIM